jgi:hypothetical protein
MQSNRCSTVVARLDGLAPAELLAVAGEAVRRASGQPLAGRDGRGLVASVVALHRLETRVHAEKLRRIAAVESSQAYRGMAMSGAGLWTDRLGVGRGEARTLVEAAGVLERMPALAARHADGVVGASHVADAARTVAQLDQLAAEQSDACAGEGGDVPARDAAVAALDAVIAEQADEDADGDGAGRLVGRPELRRRLDEFTRERAPGVLAERELRLRARRNLRLVVDTRDPDRVPQLLADLAPVTFAKAKAMIHALARQHAADDPRTFAQRCHDAFERILDLAAASGELPDLAGDQPRVLLLVDAHTLHTNAHDDHDDEAARPAAAVRPPVLDGYGEVSNETAKLLCCDAQTTAVLLGEGGAVLDVGRDRRTPNRAQRRGTFARDRACIGCGAPLAYCQVHHIEWWEHGGRTDIDNLVAVCWDCHARIHHCGWQVTRRPDGAFALRPPSRADGAREPDRLAG